MKKFGFTLAEVLITLGIIGVIAAITLPSLMTDTTSAQIGPKLAKAVAMFEQATQAMLNENEVDIISDLDFMAEGTLQEHMTSYMSAISRHLKIVPTTTPIILTYQKAPATLGCGITRGMLGLSSPGLSKDGILYLLFITPVVTQSSSATESERILGYVFVDINGESKPNTPATDLFAFALANNGTLKPVGGSYWNGTNNACSWRLHCPVDLPPSHPLACTGHVFENNLKALYK